MKQFLKERTDGNIDSVFYLKFKDSKLDDVIALNKQVDKAVQRAKNKTNNMYRTYYTAKSYCGDDFIHNRLTLRITLTNSGL